MATEEITISELELADEVLADMTLPVDTATETRAVTLKQLRAWLGSALPVGSVFASVGRLDDERFTLLDGKTISRIGTYEAFCNKVVEKVQAGTWKACTEEEFNLEVSETGQCGKFVVSNDYVRIPKLGNSLCSGVIDGTIAVVGNGIALGLTNGTANTTLGLVNTSADGQKGRFTNVPSGYGVPVTTASQSFNQGTGIFGVTTDPAKSGIEANINSVEVFYYMVISTEGQTAEVEVDINQIYEDLNIKANSDLSNVASVASSFKEQSTSWSALDMNATSVTFNTGTNFELPADGRVFMNSTAGTTNTGRYWYLSVNGTRIDTRLLYGSNAQVSLVSPLLKKGQIVNISTTTGTSGSCYFKPVIA